MLIPALVLAVVSVWIEMMLVTKVDFIRRFVNKYEIVGLCFSFALSVAIGEPFGAQGVTALLGAVISTGATLVIYKCHMLSIVDKYRAHKNEIHQKIAIHTDRAVKTVQFIWRIITFPGYVIQQMIKFINITRAWFAATNIKIRKVIHHG